MHNNNVHDKPTNTNLDPTDYLPKLEQLGTLAGKEYAWIERDLNVSTPSTFLARWIWTIIAKRFNYLRELLYHVNLEDSASLLKSIGAEIDRANLRQVEVYNTAVATFNKVAPRHQVTQINCERPRNPTPSPKPHPSAPTPSPHSSSSSVTKKKTSTKDKKKEKEPEKKEKETSILKPIPPTLELAPFPPSPSFSVTKEHTAIDDNGKENEKEKFNVGASSQSLPQKQKISLSVEDIAEIMRRAEEQFDSKTLNFALVTEMEKAKRKAEKFLAQRRLPEKHRNILNVVIQKYDEIVKQSPVLDILQNLAREITNPISDNTPYYDKFQLFISYALTQSSESNYTIYSHLQEAWQKDSKTWKRQWNIVREKMWSAWEECRDFLEMDQKITFITGSKSSSIPLIKRVPTRAPGLASKPALVPTGQLVSAGLVPMAGELCRGIGEGGGQ